MQMSSFGQLQISVIPSKADPEVMEMVMAAEKRSEVVRMSLQKGESIDNFTRRMKSMLMGLLNSEVRKGEKPETQSGPPKEVKPFDQAKAEMTGQNPAPDKPTNDPPTPPVKTAGTPSGPVRA